MKVSCKREILEFIAAVLLVFAGELELLGKECLVSVVENSGVVLTC